MPSFRPRPLRDTGTALALLSRLPVPADHERGARASWAWPLAGIVLGALAGAAGSGAVMLGLSSLMAAGTVLAVSILLTGAMHEDGLADTADGLWGGWTRERRLEIMKDSRIGVYGVLALIIVTGLRWSALAELFGSDAPAWAVIAVLGGISRLPMVWIAALLPMARATGASAMTGAPRIEEALLASLLTFLATVLLTGLWSLAALGAALIPAAALAVIAQRKIGGQTGDILGSSQQLAELGALIAFTTYMT